MEELEVIKRILDSDAGFETDNKREEKTLVDNRFYLLNKYIEEIDNKTIEFYEELIKLLSMYIDKYYDTEIDDFPLYVLDKSCKYISQEYSILTGFDVFNLMQANKSLSQELFDYVCYVLKNNSDVKLEVETLKQLFNRSPKLYEFSVEDSYRFRLLDFKKLAGVFKNNDTIKKSNICSDDIIKILLDTCQISNDEVFCQLITKEDFYQSHDRIYDILSWCNAKVFADIIKIIFENYDTEFNVINILRKRNKDYFCELFISELLHSYLKKDYETLIHKILNDPEIKIDYDTYLTDYKGETDLKSLIALSNNRTLIKDMLKNEENLETNYYHGEDFIQLFRLYAIIGEYEKALNVFYATYDYSSNYTIDFNDDFNRVGYAYGDWFYSDSLENFIDDLYTSFSFDNVNYVIVKKTIYKLLNSKCVKYISLTTLPTIKEMLMAEDYKELLSLLIQRKDRGELYFIDATEEEHDIYNHYIINIVADKDLFDYISYLNQNGKIKGIKPL